MVYTNAIDRKKLLKAILNETVASSGAHASGGKRADLKDGLLVELISKIKAKGLSPDEFEAQTMLRAQSQQTTPKGEIELSLAQQLCPIYATYVEDCRRNNSLDFDDLLMYGVKLLGERNDCVDCQHIFVDEFQDTNSIQFRLMTLFAKMQRNISVVGDPDQSSKLHVSLVNYC
jgi:DNA helicase II / ATP-dependent DNA helicase PcrA